MSSSSTSSSQIPLQTTASSPPTNPSSQTPKQTTTTSRPSRNISSSVHSPSDLPPVPYAKQNSPWKPKQPRQHSRDIEATKLGTLMNRMDRIEEAVEKYVDERGKKALKKSVVPGLDAKDSAKA